MKEQIISLEANDDLNSLRDKLSRAQSTRILLRWEKLEGAINRRLDLELARRWAQMAGSEIVVVSAHPTVQRLAENARLPWFADLASASASARQVRRKKMPKRKIQPRHIADIPTPPQVLKTDDAIQLPAGRRWALGLFVFFLLALIPLLALPSVAVTATFASRPVTASAALDITQASRISISLSTSGRRTTSGRASSPSTYAAGFVLLTNAGQTTLNVPPGLIVSDMLGVAFETMGGAVLKPGADISLAIRARRAGSISNLPANRITQVQGELGLVLHANNPAPTSGGSEIERGRVTDLDLAALQQDLAADVRTQALAGLAAAAGPEKMLAPASIQIVIDPTDLPDAAVGATADTVGQTLHATASGVAFSNADLASASAYILQLALHSGERLAENTVTYTIEPGSAGGWRLAASGRAFSPPDEQDLTAALRMQSVPGAQTILQNQFGATSLPEILINPSWWPWLPLFPFRMQILLEPAAE